MTMPRWLFVFVTTGLLLTPHPALTDMGPLQAFRGGGVVAPNHPHQSIRLDSQEVVIRLENNSYLVNVVFHLFNTGDTTTESVGFPKWAASRTDSYPTFIRFEGSINGRKINFHEEKELSEGKKPVRKPSSQERFDLRAKPMEEQRQWLVSQVTFPGRTETTICVLYEAPYGMDGQGYREASYIYGTGSLWNGNIGKAVFVIDSTEVGGTEKISTYFEERLLPVSENANSVPRPILKNVVRYEIRDFKPQPEAYLRCKLNEAGGPIKANFVRQKPIGHPIPLAPPARPSPTNIPSDR